MLTYMIPWHSPESNITKCVHELNYRCSKITFLTHWGRVTHICVNKPTIIASDNGLSPGRRQAIIWTSAGILLIGPLGTNFSDILTEIITFSFKKMRLKVSSAKWRPCCLGLNVLRLLPIYPTGQWVSIYSVDSCFAKKNYRPPNHFCAYYHFSTLARRRW